MPKPVSTFECGDHICALYSTKTELAAIAAHFLIEGARRGERCWYVAAGNEGGAVRSALRKGGVNVNAAIRRGALNVFGDSDTYAVRGGFNPERTVQVFSDAIEQALHDGYTGFRAAADMSWALTLKNGLQTVIAYEALLRTLFATCKVTGLCLYDRKRMPLQVLNGALVTHHFAAVGSDFQRNPFYAPDVVTLPNEDESAVVSKLQTFQRPTIQLRRP